MLERIGLHEAGIEAVDLLVECHGRIRKALATAHRLAAGTSADSESIADAALGVSSYFAEALPLRAQDAEESILHRLPGTAARVANTPSTWRPRTLDPPLRTVGADSSAPLEQPDR